MCCYGDEDTNTVSKELHGTSTSLIFPFVYAQIKTTAY